jgi:hypothetical protein|tara:strand:+ start:207 stop:737 length:531 start_codon:yes stop_codon:yes gene_type:complete
MDLYIIFNTEDGIYNTIYNVKIEYIISISEVHNRDIKLIDYVFEDGQIYNSCAISINNNDVDYASKITVPLNTIELYFLTCKEHASGGDYDGIIIYVAPSLKEILDHAIDYYDASHNITNENEPDECELGLCKKNDRSICRKHMLDELKNNGYYDLECTGIEGCEIHMYCVPLNIF